MSDDTDQAPVTEPFHLTDLDMGSSGAEWRRYLVPGSWRRVAYHAFVAMSEFAIAFPRDVGRALLASRTPDLRIAAGDREDRDATRIALYVHYSASGLISEMVRRQLAIIQELGFSIVFISMSKDIPETDWSAVRRLSALMVRRANFGLDFGAWRDLMPEVRRRWPAVTELLLANDSVLGPIHSMESALAAMRSEGDGLFGLTESLQGGPHLQSYFLLARGKPVVSDMMRFVECLYITHSKWLLIRMAEVRLSRWMRRRGHRVAALFGYDRVIRAAVADPMERQRLQSVYKKLGNLELLSDTNAVAALRRWPLNPTHHLWHVLTTRFDYPFLKTELIRLNPARLPAIAEWPAVVPPDAPCPLHVLRDHLGTLAPRER